MGGAYKFHNGELRYIQNLMSGAHARGDVAPAHESIHGTINNKITAELARRDTVAKRQAGKGVVRKKDIPYEQMIAAAMRINEGATIRATVAATGVPYGRVWKMKRTRMQEQEKTNEPGQPNKNRSK